MRILILSNINRMLDEGQRNVAIRIATELSKRHDVNHVNAKESVLSRNFWRETKQFQPDIIHIFLRPCMKTLILSKTLKTICPNAKMIISALQPPLKPNIIKFSIPDLVLAISRETKELFTKYGCRTMFLRCGVDTEKFVPVNGGRKIFLRKKYGINESKFVVLHVGSLTEGRNLLPMIEIQNENDNQVLIVSNITFPQNQKTYIDLKESGCIVYHEYFENIVEIYQLADCYLFPTLNPSNCIELPLSILEAMSCNLPVVTTKFRAVPEFFDEGNGLFFIDKKMDFLQVINIIKKKEIPIKTRDKVMHLTWENVVLDLENIYRKLIDEQD